MNSFVNELYFIINETDQGFSWNTPKLAKVFLTL